MANVDVRILVGTGSGEQEVSFGFSADRLKAEGVFTKNYKMYWGEPTSTGYNIYFCRYGHGLGMSQYGAQARAREGQTYQQVLKFYYGKMKLTDVCELNPERPFAYSLNIKAYGEFNTTNVNLRSGPSASFTSLGKFNTGTHVDVINAVNGWICCIADGKLGYVRGDYIDVKLFPSPIAAQQRVCEAKQPKRPPFVPPLLNMQPKSCHSVKVHRFAFGLKSGTGTMFESDTVPALLKRAK